MPEVIDDSSEAHAAVANDEEFLVANGSDNINDGNFVVTDFLLPNSTIDAFLKIS